MSRIDYCFCFVAQRGKLEIQALLLARSLRRNVRCTYEAVVAVPKQYGDLAPPVRTTLLDDGVRIVDIVNPIAYGYPIGNKFACLQAAQKVTTARRLVFLDTDMLCNAPFLRVEGIGATDLGLRVAGYPHMWKESDRWKPLYELFDLPLPNDRVVTAMTRDEMLPYFNAGFIVVPSDSCFPEAWRTTAQALFSAYNGDRQELHWLDQLAVPSPLRGKS